jgi:Flp pilus assembly protein TadB
MTGTLPGRPTISSVARQRRPAMIFAAPQRVHPTCVVVQGASVERPTRRTTDTLTWTAAGFYALGFALFVAVVLAGALALLWLVIVFVLAGLAVSLLLEYLWRRRHGSRGREMRRSDAR